MRKIIKLAFRVFLLLCIGMLLAVAYETLTENVQFDGVEVITQALNNGDLESGDTVRAEVTEIEDNPVLGKLVWLGDDVYIIGYRDAGKVQPGDKIVFDVDTARSLFGKWAITDVK